MSEKCLELIDQLSDTSGLDSRSQIIEEAIFAVNDVTKLINGLSQMLNQKQSKVNKETGIMIMYTNFVAITASLSKFYRFPTSFPKFPVEP